MMKKQISLKLYVSILFLSLTSVLVIGFVKLSGHYYILGMDNITASDMVLVAKRYLENVEPVERKDPDFFNGHWLSSHWQDMPAELRDSLREAPERPGELVKSRKPSSFQKPGVLAFSIMYREGGEQIYVARQVSRRSAPPLIGENAAASRKILVIIAISVGLALVVITRLLLRHISRPVVALGDWARSLDEKKVKETPPDFTYPELNELAELIRTSLASVEAGMDREHTFLRHASHELRTPISVIRNNVELMRKLREQTGRDTQRQQEQVVERIDRASLTMKHLTETLLWLSHEEKGALAVEAVQLDRLIMELSEDHFYLLSGKDVGVQHITQPFKIEIPLTITRIVLANLIRNAFQHTNEGRIVIRQQDNEITIVNNHETHGISEDLGFGLGLKLTEKLTEKLGWTFEVETTVAEYRVKVVLFR